MNDGFLGDIGPTAAQPNQFIIAPYSERTERRYDFPGCRRVFVPHGFTCTLQAYASDHGDTRLSALRRSLRLQNDFHILGSPQELRE
jgi:hypothetical protein